MRSVPLGGKRSTAVIGSQVAREQLRSVNPKFHPGPTPLEREPFEKTIQPQYRDQLEQMMKLMTKYADEKGDDDTRKAVALWKTQVQQGTFNDQVKFDFARRFYYWLLGRGTDEDHKRTFWGRGNAAVYNPEVKQYIETFASKRLDYAQQLALLAMNVPTTLNQYYLYFKYIVGGNLERKKTADGTQFWDMSDEDYLSDFEMFRQEFDDKIGGRDQWLGKPYVDNSSQRKVGESPYPDVNNQAQMRKYAVQGLSRQPGPNDPVATSMVESAVRLEQSFQSKSPAQIEQTEEALEQADVPNMRSALGNDTYSPIRPHYVSPPRQHRTPNTPFTPVSRTQTQTPKSTSLSLLPEESSYDEPLGKRVEREQVMAALTKREEDEKRKKEESAERERKRIIAAGPPASLVTPNVNPYKKGDKPAVVKKPDLPPVPPPPSPASKEGQQIQQLLEESRDLEQHNIETPRPTAEESAASAARVLEPITPSKSLTQELESSGSDLSGATSSEATPDAGDKRLAELKSAMASLPVAEPEPPLASLSVLNAAIDEEWLLDEIADINLPDSPNATQSTEKITAALKENAQTKGISKEDQMLVEEAVVALAAVQRVDNPKDTQTGALLQAIGQVAQEALAETDAAKKMDSAKVIKTLGKEQGKRSTRRPAKSARAPKKDWEAAGNLFKRMETVRKAGADLTDDDRKLAETYIKMGLFEKNVLLTHDAIVRAMKPKK